MRILGHLLFTICILIFFGVTADWVGWNYEWSEAELLRNRWPWYLAGTVAGAGGVILIEKAKGR